MKKRLPRGSKGFTLIEILVVVIVTALLSALTIVYSHTGQNEVALTIETAKLAQTILQAKELSVTTYNNTATRACAYGVAINYTNSSYKLFSYTPNGAGVNTCPTFSSTTSSGIPASSMSDYSPGTADLILSTGVVFQSSTAPDAISVVMFYPPDPETMIARNTAPTAFISPVATSKIYLATVDGNGASAITVSPAGQVSY